MSELNWESRTCDWDLHAIVKGQAKVSNIMEMPPYDWLEEYYQNQENATLFLDELHQICTPNYHDSSNISSLEIVDNNNTIINTIDDKIAEFPLDESKQKIEDVSYTKNSGNIPRRRKNKHKKTLVQQATGDRILSDKWNWRKYGEKVIKGSPYPRSYYRCSNSGGCLARKQVELSCTDPGKFLIAYIDDHNHPYPSRRPSQAGRTSRRFHASQPKVGLTSIDEPIDMPSNRTTHHATSQSIVTKDKVIVHWDRNDDSTVECVEECVVDDMDLICDNLGSYCDQFSFLWNVA